MGSGASAPVLPMTEKKVSVYVAEQLGAQEVPQSGDKLDIIQPNITYADERSWRPLQQENDIKPTRLALVGYGPSLTYSWKELPEYGVVWTTSGAHDYLLQKGITPKIHTDVDFRAHKSEMVAEMQPSTRYVMATAIHPVYQDRLAKFNHEYFHAYCDDRYTYGPQFPRYISTWDVGQQALVMAYCQGWRKIDLYGFDYNHQFDGRIKENAYESIDHAGAHPGIKTDVKYVMANENLFESSTAHILACFMMEKLLRTLPDLDLQIYSNGLLVNFLECRENVPEIQKLLPYKELKYESS